MIITARSTDIIKGKDSDNRYHISRVSETTLVPETKKDIDDIEEFIRQHVSTVAVEKD